MNAIAVWMQRVRTISLAACLVAPGAAAADSLSVWAIGLPHGYIVMEHQARTIQVTPEDAARGFVDVSGASRLVVTTRAPADYAVHISSRAPMFRSVQVHGIGRTTELGTQGGTLVGRSVPAGKSVVSLSYRFALAPGTAAGTYPWPLRIVARAAAAADVVAEGESPAHLTLSERSSR